MVRERPILFSAPMVRAILEGRKTQTRRIIRDQGGCLDLDDDDDRAQLLSCFDYGAPGDRLWVRETHAQFSVGNRAGLAPQCVAYRATCDADGGFDYVNNGDEIMRIRVTKWTPAIYMPRWASRITLEVAAVRVERLQDISEEDARAEGVKPFFEAYPCISRDQRLDGELCSERPHRSSFQVTWDAINGERALWVSNPWVWVVEFTTLAER